MKLSGISKEAICRSNGEFFAITENTVSHSEPTDIESLHRNSKFATLLLGVIIPKVYPTGTSGDCRKGRRQLDITLPR